MYYKYSITKDNDSYSFGLYPNNNNHQPIGVSGHYQTYDEAKRAISEFQSLVKTTEDALLCYKENDRYYFKLANNRFDLSFTSKKGYANKTNCLKSIQSIYKNIDAPLKTR